MEHSDNNTKISDSASIMNIYKHFCNFSNIVYFLASLSLGLLSLLLILYTINSTVTNLMNGVLKIQSILTAVSYIIISVAVFDISKSFIEEEVIRDKELRSATEARKTLTKFSVVIIISISLEALVFVILAGKENIQNLIYPCALLITSAVFMLCLAIYQKLSISYES